MMALGHGLTWLFLAALQAGTPGSDATAPPAADPKLTDLERRTRDLEANASAHADEDGFRLRSSSGDFALTVRGYLQADARAYIDNGPPATPSTILLRRARLVLEGTMFRFVGYKLMPDFAGGQTVLYDGFVDIRPWREFGIQIGKYKPPLGLERLQSARHLSFVERGLPTNLVPNRDVGAQVSGELWKGTAQYALGVFDGTYDGAVNEGDTNDAKDVAGRLFVRPFALTRRPRLAQLGLGFAGSWGRNVGTPTAPNLPTYRDPSQIAFFSYLADGTAAGTVVASGGHTRLVPQAYYYVGQLGILAEYAYSCQHVRKGAVTGDAVHHAFSVAAEIVVAGGHAGFDGVVVTRPVGTSPHAWGAFALAARYGQQIADDAIFTAGFADPARSAREARALSVGANWYANRALKVNVDYEHVEFLGGGQPTRPAGNALLARTQVAF
jgi:phosphate-selective porin OprO/OprP